MGWRVQEPPNLAVSSPVVKSSSLGKKHHEYRLLGADFMGEIDVMRRYSEFLFFRQFLQDRWPGLYIPPMPQKQTVGNKEEQFIEERTHFLDRFMKEICRLPYLYESEELQGFLRPQGDVERYLKMMPRQGVSSILARMRQKIQIYEAVQDVKLKLYHEDIITFIKDCKEVQAHLG